MTPFKTLNDPEYRAKLEGKVKLGQAVQERFGISEDSIDNSFDSVVSSLGLSGNYEQDLKAFDDSNAEIEERAMRVRKIEGQSTAVGLGKMAIKGGINDFLLGGTEGALRIAAKGESIKEDRRQAEASSVADFSNWVNKKIQTSSAPLKIKEAVMGLAGRSANFWNQMGGYRDDTGEEVLKWEADAINESKQKLEAAFEVQQDLESSTTGQVFRGLGQAGVGIPYYLSGMGAVMTVGQLFTEVRDDYVSVQKEKGLPVDEDEAFRVGMLNVPAAIPEYLMDRFVVGKVFGNMKGVKIKDVATTFASSAVVGGMTEGAQNTWQNAIAKYLSGYDPDRELDEGLIDSILVGGIVDSTISTGAKGTQAIYSKFLDTEKAATKLDFAATKDIDNETISREVLSNTGDPIKAELAAMASNGDEDARNEYINSDYYTEAEEADIDPIEREVQLSDTEAEVVAAEREREQKQSTGQEARRQKAEQEEQVRVEATNAAIEITGLLERGDIELDQDDTRVVNAMERLNQAADKYNLKGTEREGYIERELLAASQNIGMSLEDFKAKISTMRVLGEATRQSLSETIDYKIKLHAGANPLTVAHELTHVELKRKVKEHSDAQGITYEEAESDIREELLVWKRKIEAETGEQTHGDSFKELDEWIAEKGAAWFLHNWDNPDVVAMPKTILDWIKAVIDRFVSVFADARLLAQMEADGRIDPEFKAFLQRAVGEYVDADPTLSEVSDWFGQQQKRTEQAEMHREAMDKEDLGPELLDLFTKGTAKTRLKIPTPSADPANKGELENLREDFGKRWAFVSRNDGTLDGLAEALRGRGFRNIRTPDDAINAIQASLRGEQQYGQGEITASQEMDILDEDVSYQITESPAFREWFKDSKVVDENGDPLVVYHGTSAEFEAFDNSKTGTHDRGLWGKGHYFSANVRGPNSYALRQGEGARLIPAYVSIKNPLILTTGKDLKTLLPDGTNYRELLGPNLDGSKIKEIALKGGHDGLIQIKPDGGIGDMVAYDAKQIKSAYNRGTFDPQDPRISFQIGEVDPEAEHQRQLDNLARKLAAAEKKRLIQIQKLHDQGEDVTDKLQKLDEVRKTLPTAIRHRLGGDIQISKRKTAMGRQNELSRRIQRAVELEEGHEAQKRKQWLRQTFRRFGAMKGAKLQAQAKEMTNEVRDAMRVAAYAANSDTADRVLERMPKPDSLTQEKFEQVAQDFAGLLLPNKKDYKRIEAAYFAVKDFIRDGKYKMDTFRTQRAEAFDAEVEKIQSSILRGKRAKSDMEIAQALEGKQLDQTLTDWVDNGLTGLTAGMENILRRMDGEQGGPLWQWIYADDVDGVDASVNRTNIYKLDAGDYIISGLSEAFPELKNADGQPDQKAIIREVAKLEERPKEGEPTGIVYADKAGEQLKDQPLTRAEAMSVWLTLRQKGSHDTFYAQHGIGDIDTFKGQLEEYIGEDGMAIIDKVITPFYEDAYYQLNETHERIEGFTLDKVKDYFRFIRESGLAGKDIEDAINPFSNFNDKDTKAGVDKGSLITRTEGAESPFRFLSAFDMLAQSVGFNANYIGKAGLEKRIRRLSGDAEFRRAVKQTFGASGAKQFFGAADSVMLGHIKTEKWGSRLFEGLRTVGVTSVLSLKPKLLFTQLTSIPAGMVDMDAKEWASRAFEIVKNPEAHWKILKEVPAMRDRLSRSQSQEVLTELRKIGKLNLRDDIMGRLEVVTRYSMLLIKIGDVAGASLSAGPIYFDTYDRVLAETGDAVQAKFAANGAFSRAVNRSQQSPHLHARSQAYQGNAIFRALMQFRSSPTQYLSETHMAIREFVAAQRRTDWSPAKKKRVARQAMKAYFVYQILLPQLFYAVQNAFVGLWLDDEERQMNYWKGMLLTLGFGNLSSVPLWGDAALALASKATDTPYFQVATSAVGLERVARLPDDIMNVVNPDDLDEFLDGTARLLDLTGVGASTMKKTVEATFEFIETGDPKEILEILGWSEWLLGD